MKLHIISKMGIHISIISMTSLRVIFLVLQSLLHGKPPWLIRVRTRFAICPHSDTWRKARRTQKVNIHSFCFSLTQVLSPTNWKMSCVALLCPWAQRRYTTNLSRGYNNIQQRCYFIWLFRLDLRFSYGSMVAGIIGRITALNSSVVAVKVESSVWGKV